MHGTNVKNIYVCKTAKGTVQYSTKQMPKECINNTFLSNIHMYLYLDPNE